MSWFELTSGDFLQYYLKDISPCPEHKRKKKFQSHRVMGPERKPSHSKPRTVTLRVGISLTHLVTPVADTVPGMWRTLSTWLNEETNSESLTAGLTLSCYCWYKQKEILCKERTYCQHFIEIKRNLKGKTPHQRLLRRQRTERAVEMLSPFHLIPSQQYGWVWLTGKGCIPYPLVKTFLEQNHLD